MHRSVSKRPWHYSCWCCKSRNGRRLANLKSQLETQEGMYASMTGARGSVDAAQSVGTARRTAG
jgi:hypothetical protein